MSDLYPIIRRARRPLTLPAPERQPEPQSAVADIKQAQAQSAAIVEQTQPVEPKPEAKRARSR